MKGKILKSILTVTTPLALAMAFAAANPTTAHAETRDVVDVRAGTKGEGYIFVDTEGNRYDLLYDHDTDTYTEKVSFKPHYYDKNNKCNKSQEAYNVSLPAKIKTPNGTILKTSFSATIKFNKGDRLTIDDECTFSVEDVNLENLSYIKYGKNQKHHKYGKDLSEKLITDYTKNPSINSYLKEVVIPFDYSTADNERGLDLDFLSTPYKGKWQSPVLETITLTGNVEGISCGYIPKLKKIRAKEGMKRAEFRGGNTNSILNSLPKSTTYLVFDSDQANFTVPGHFKTVDIELYKTQTNVTIKAGVKNLKIYHRNPIKNFKLENGIKNVDIQGHGTTYKLPDSVQKADIYADGKNTSIITGKTKNLKDLRIDADKNSYLKTIKFGKGPIPKSGLYYMVSTDNDHKNLSNKTKIYVPKNMLKAYKNKSKRLGFGKAKIIGY